MSNGTYSYAERLRALVDDADTRPRTRMLVGLRRTWPGDGVSLAVAAMARRQDSEVKVYLYPENASPRSRATLWFVTDQAVDIETIGRLRAASVLGAVQVGQPCAVEYDDGLVLPALTPPRRPLRGPRLRTFQ